MSYKTCLKKKKIQLFLFIFCQGDPGLLGDPGEHGGLGLKVNMR